MYVARDQLCSTTYKSLLIWKITRRSFKLCGWQREEPPRQDNTQLSGVLNTVHLHLEGKGHTFEFASVHILAREDQRCERGVKKAIYVLLQCSVEAPSTLTNTLLQVTSIGHVIGWSKVSQWFHSKLLVVITHAFVCTPWLMWGHKWLIKSSSVKEEKKRNKETSWVRGETSSKT